MRLRFRLTAAAPDEAQHRPMSFRTAASETTPPEPPGDGIDAPRLDGEDALTWAQRIWEDRETWLRTRGGVESVFMAAQLMGCREDAVAWLRQRTRL